MISIIGGTYREINYENKSTEIFGSGLRCSKYLLENNVEVKFNTSGNDETEAYLNEYSKVYHQFDFNCINTDNMITFQYSYAMDSPTILPNLLNIIQTKTINIEGEDVVYFGMLESKFSVKANKVVYDPQTSLNPIKFSEVGNAKQLVYIVNFNEAKAISGFNKIEEIKNFFFNVEKAHALIIKNGPFGATLFYDKFEFKIPSYVTNNVNKIGSGDIFTSSFAYYWLEKKATLEESASNASKATALFCENVQFARIDSNTGFGFKKFEVKNLQSSQVYLASPIFSLSEIILIDKIRNSFIEMGVKVFSPFHDIGYGDDNEIAKKDLDGLENSDIIFCVLDNLDSGTLVEAGYSMAKGKKLIGYHTTCDKGSLLMLKPSKMKIYTNLTTAIYQTIWSL